MLLTNLNLEISTFQFLEILSHRGKIRSVFLETCRTSAIEILFRIMERHFTFWKYSIPNVLQNPKYTFAEIEIERLLFKRNLSLAVLD